MANTGSRLVIKKKGGAEMVIGAVFLLFPLVLLPYRPVQAMPMPAADYFIRFIFMLAFIAGFNVLVNGIRKRKLYQKLLRLGPLFDNSHRIPLEMASGLLGCGLTSLVGDVRAMQKFGLVQGLYADLLRKDLVYAGDRFVADPPAPAETGGVTLREDHKKSVKPIYLFGLAWASYAFFFPFYRPLDLAIALILSLIAFFHTAWNAPARAVIVEVPPEIPKPVQTGNEALDEMLKGVQLHLTTLRRLEKSNNSKLAGQVRDILNTTERIIEQVKKHPEKSRDMRQFFNYTLPTTIGLLQNYDELRAQPVQGKNIAAALEKIEGMMCTIVDAFHRQLDALFADKALNISVELEVMGQMLKSGVDMKSMYDDFKR